MQINPERVRTLRLEKGWTQAHLAHAADLSVRTVQRSERDGSASAETATSLCAALDIDLAVLTAQDKKTETGLTVSVKLLVMACTGALFIGALAGIGIARLAA